MSNKSEQNLDFSEIETFYHCIVVIGKFSIAVARVIFAEKTCGLKSLFMLLLNPLCFELGQSASEKYVVLGF